MTCREFMDAAELLTPSQLLRLTLEEQPLSAHQGECGACREWLESHRVLGNALQALSSETTMQQAGPQVEQALLRAFRKQEFAARVVVIPQRAASSLWTLSRVFEFGAYAAVAAALAVGVFLGVRVLRDQQNNTAPVQATVTAPQTNAAGVSTNDAKVGPGKPTAEETAEKAASRGPGRTLMASSKRSSTAKEDSEASTSESAGYVPLMFCDPLICSGEEQVVRMELPAAGSVSADGRATQTVLADVVIGEDGLVRGMRIVN